MRTLVLIGLICFSGTAALAQGVKDPSTPNSNVINQGVQQPSRPTATRNIPPAQAAPPLGVERSYRYRNRPYGGRTKRYR